MAQRPHNFLFLFTPFSKPHQFLQKKKKRGGIEPTSMPCCLSFFSVSPPCRAHVADFVLHVLVCDYTLLSKLSVLFAWTVQGNILLGNSPAVAVLFMKHVCFNVFGLRREWLAISVLTVANGFLPTITRLPLFL